MGFGFVRLLLDSCWRAFLINAHESTSDSLTPTHHFSPEI